MLLGKLGLGVALLRRQEERAIDDAYVGRVEACGEPVGTDQGVGTGVVHWRVLRREQ